MPTQHRLLASLPTLSRMCDNKPKINPESPIPPTFENIIHWSKMATSISAKIKFPTSRRINPRGDALSSEPRSSQVQTQTGDKWHSHAARQDGAAPWQWAKQACCEKHLSNNACLQINLLAAKDNASWKKVQVHSQTPPSSSLWALHLLRRWKLESSSQKSSGRETVKQALTLLVITAIFPCNLPVKMPLNPFARQLH